MSPSNQDILAKPYIPIDTDFVDNIELYSTCHLHVQVDYKDRDGTLRALRGFIAEVYTNHEHEEYMKMVDGRCLRLDQLVQVEPIHKSAVTDRDEAIDLAIKLDIRDSKFFPNGVSK